MTDMIYEEESYAILGCCFEVYNEIGAEFLEPIYHECLEIEMDLQGIPYEAQLKLPISYKGKTLDQHYRADIVCFEKVVLELKSVEQLTEEHTSQILSYLNAGNYKLGPLINFGYSDELEYRRVIN